MSAVVQRACRANCAFPSAAVAIRHVNSRSLADLAHPSAMVNDTRYVEANGLRFAYLEDGAGPLVLLLHGFPDTARTWDHIRPQIAAKGYRVVTPWLRGYAPTA